MSATSNSMPAPALEARPQRSGIGSARRSWYWCVRRELWENRSIYVAPLAIAGVVLAGFFITAARLPGRMRELAALDPAHHRAVLAAPFDIAAGVMMLTTILVSVFYSQDALHAERRDRSILFWKSLPVSDRTTVLAKAGVLFLVLPLVTFAVSVVLQLIMLLVSSAVLAGSGLGLATLWTELSFPRMSWLLLYHLLTAHMLWPAPIYCWLLLVSGWARRATLLWAALPMVAIAGIERLAFGTSHFAAMVGQRLMGATPEVVLNRPDLFPTHPATHIVFVEFFGRPDLWIGLAIAAAFLAAAVRLRRSQAPV